MDYFDCQVGFYYVSLRRYKIRLSLDNQQLYGAKYKWSDSERKSALLQRGTESNFEIRRGNIVQLRLVTCTG